MSQNLKIPDELRAATAPLFDAIPLSEAMSQLVVTRGGAVDLVEQIAREPVVAARPALVAGLWLYVDQLERSHVISQAMENPTGSYWHAIMHRREGDFGNSHYWFRKVGSHPAMKLIEDYNAHTFIDEVEAAHRQGESPASLIDTQRREWARLFEWCAR